MGEHYGPWREHGGGWMRLQLEDGCVALSTGTRGGGYYPFRYQGEERCGCKAPPDDWWCAGSLPCGCPRWHPTLEEAKALIDSDMRAAGCVLYDSQEDADLAEDALRRARDGTAWTA